MFWGLTIEPGKHYSQTVDQSFHVSMAALDTREKSGMTQLLVRHEKAEFLLCTLQYGDDVPYPLLQQQLNLNLSEGSEISFYSEGNGTIHLTGYLVVDNPMELDRAYLLNAENSLLEEDEEDFDSEDDDDDDDEDDDDDDDESDNEVSWTKMIEGADDDEEDDDDSEEEEWTPQAAKKNKKRKVLEGTTPDIVSSGLKKKRKAAAQAEALSKNEMDNEDDDEDEEEDDMDFVPPDVNDEEDDDDDDDGDDDEDFEEEEDDEEDEDAKDDDEEEEDMKDEDEEIISSDTVKREKSPTPSPTKGKTEPANEKAGDEKLSKKKKRNKKKKKANTGDGELPLQKADNKENIAAQNKEKPSKKQQQQKKPPSAPKSIKLRSGVIIEDLKIGEGKLAKPGKKVFMYYRGVLANNQKQFDSVLSGKPFIFTLGRREVIKGWDEGIIGMKAGGKRRLTIPPAQAYGSERTGHIPANSTLVFDVELKQVR